MLPFRYILTKTPKKTFIMATQRSLATTLIALASGVALGILIAPASGRKTRRKIRRSAVGVKDTLGYTPLRAKELFKDLRSTVQEAITH